MNMSTNWIYSCCYSCYIYPEVELYLFINRQFISWNLRWLNNHINLQISKMWFSKFFKDFFEKNYNILLFCTVRVLLPMNKFNDLVCFIFVIFDKVV